MPVSNQNSAIRELKAQINFYLRSIIDPAKPHHRHIILRDMIAQTRRGKFYSNEALHGTRWAHLRSAAKNPAFVSACRELLAECDYPQSGGDAA